MEKAPQKTPLHAWHLSRDANMADFGGYEMPLWYSSVKKEHLKDNRRTITVTIAEDIRPDRTARLLMREMV